MSVNVYPTYKRDRNLALHDWTSGAYTYRVLLLWSGSFNVAHEFVSDLNTATNEVTSAVIAGYVRKDLSGRSLAANGTGYDLKASNPSWAALGPSATQITAAALAKYTAGDPDSAMRLVCWWDGGTSPNLLPLTTTGGPFEITFTGGVVFTDV